MSFKITSRKGVKNRATSKHRTLNSAISQARQLAKRNGKNYYVYEKTGKSWRYRATIKPVKKQRRSKMGRQLKPVMDTVVYLGALSVGVNIIDKLRG